jgi:hypothetical protein
MNHTFISMKTTHANHHLLRQLAALTGEPQYVILARALAAEHERLSHTMVDPVLTTATLSYHREAAGEALP